MKRTFFCFVSLVFNLSVNAQQSQGLQKPITIAAIKTPDAGIIKPSRTASFDTDEASWIDVDISPNGQTILFTILGDLYTMPASGGTATQLTRGLAINRFPTWSPDGKYFAYISDATGFIRVHISDADGNFHKVLGEVKNQLQPERLNILWLPDSKHILIGNDIHDLSGGVSSLPEEIRKLLGFSFDGKFMYSLVDLSWDTTAIVKLNRLTGEKENLLVYKQPWYNFNFNNIRISPDGSWLTYFKYKTYDSANGKSSPADSLMIIDLKTGSEHLLARLGIKFTGFLHNQNYSFSKDSRYLLVGYGGKIHRIDIGTGDNEIIPFTAHVNVDMGPLNYNTFPVSLDSFEVKYIRSAQKSPDGKQLIFSALSKIYIMDLPKGKPRILVSQPSGQFQPSFSPDGKWIVYVSWSDTVGGHIWKVSSSGKNPEQITSEAGLYQHPSWSLDGKRIVFAKGRNKFIESSFLDDAQIEIINLENKSIKVNADKAALFNQPVFSKDGKILFKPSQQQGREKIWPKLVSVDLATAIKTEVVQTKKESEFWYPVRQLVLSPDGRYLAFMYNEDLYLASMVNIGCSQMIFDESSPTTLIRFARGGVDPTWEKSGKMLSWVIANRYYSIDPDKIIAAATYLKPNSTLEGLPKTKIIDVDIPADQTIPINLKAPREYGKGTLALTNARIIPMKGNKVIEKGTVLINDGRFVNVDASDEINVPDQVKVIDLKGKTIIPGFIDMHSHMGETTPPDVFRQQSWKRLQNLSFGITTLRCPAGSFDMFGYEELIETGQMLGSRSFQVGTAVRTGHNLNSLVEGNVIVNNRRQMGASIIKQYQQSTRLQKQLLLKACRLADVNMTNEVEKEPLFCIGQIKDGSTGIEHNPAWGEVYDDVIKLIAQSGTYLCPTLQVCNGKEEGRHYFQNIYGQEFLEKNSRFMPDDYREWQLRVVNEHKLDSGFLDQSRIDARIKHAGGKIVMGSHGEDQGIGAHWEMWALQMGGLTNYEALETATITAAEALGMKKDLGSIEVGKIADLIILDKNPLEDIHNTTFIKYVMKAGVLYERETLNEVWPGKKSR